MSLHSIQTQFWAVRDYLSPVLRESKFKEHGRITPEEFVAAGDFLTYKFPVWTWEKGDQTKVRDFLPPDKQYLMTRGVPCMRRATSLAYTDADEDAEKMLSFADEGDAGDKEEEWVQTHSGRKIGVQNAAEIEDIPDDEADTVTTGVANLSVGGNTGAAPEPVDIDDIPDMEEEGLEGEDDAAAVAPAPAEPAARNNLQQHRKYDIIITYDKYYQTPRVWLQGYDENNRPLTPNQVFEDVSADHAFKTVTIEPFPHSAKMTLASVHPCKHASVMKKVIERMNAGVTAEQQRALTSGSKDKKRWLGGVVKKVTGGASSSASTPSAATDDEDPMRVDFYLVVFLKFIASIVPTIEVDSTTPF
ncbi:hypothetical protein DL93DRAFT_2124351 [Clavulina sp. PMI_390]|nr:hypothetical protein DL93DRAFT_2124351 [Clavulina sp. PMI_390]